MFFCESSAIFHCFFFFQKVMKQMGTMMWQGHLSYIGREWHVDWAVIIIVTLSGWINLCVVVVCNFCFMKLILVTSSVHGSKSFNLVDIFILIPVVVNAKVIFTVATVNVKYMMSFCTKSTLTWQTSGFQRSRCKSYGIWMFLYGDSEPCDDHRVSS